jgi:hypothetical protein
MTFRLTRRKPCMLSAVAVVPEPTFESQADFHALNTKGNPFGASAAAGSPTAAAAAATATAAVSTGVAGNPFVDGCAAAHAAASRPVSQNGGMDSASPAEPSAVALPNKAATNNPFLITARLGACCTALCVPAVLLQLDMKGCKAMAGAPSSQPSCSPVAAQQCCGCP